MNVLWLAPIAYAGDKECHPAPWISALAKDLVEKAGCKITMLNFHPRLENPIESFESRGIEYVFLKTPVPKVDYITLYQNRIGKIKDYILSRKDDFDLIHVHGTEHQYESSVHDLPIPHVVSMQGVMKECLKVLKERWTYTFLSWFLASKFEAKNVKKSSNFICRTHFDSGFIKAENPNARLYENWEMIRPLFFLNHFSRRKDYILFIGGTHPIKGIKEMLIAYNYAKPAVNAKLKILGKTDQTIIESIIVEEHLTNIQWSDLDIRGFQNLEGVIAAFEESYCLVHPSHIDNSPNSVCEAQVSGLPVIASNVGGVSSLIDHKETGLLTELSPREIAKNIIVLFQDDKLHEHISRQSRTMARKRHDPTDILNKTLSIYNSVKGDK